MKRFVLAEDLRLALEGPAAVAAGEAAVRLHAGRYLLRRVAGGWSLPEQTRLMHPVLAAEALARVPLLLRAAIGAAEPGVDAASEGRCRAAPMSSDVLSLEPPQVAAGLPAPNHALGPPRGTILKQARQLYVNLILVTWKGEARAGRGEMRSATSRGDA